MILDEYLLKIITNIRKKYKNDERFSPILQSQPKVNLHIINEENNKNHEKIDKIIIKDIIFGLDLGEKSDLLYIKKENIRYSPCKIDIKDWNFPKDEIIFENENVLITLVYVMSCRKGKSRIGKKIVRKKKMRTLEKKIF